MSATTEFSLYSTQVMRKKKYRSEDYYLIQYQILPTNITRTVCQTVRRITNEILGVKGLTCTKLVTKYG